MTISFRLVDKFILPDFDTNLMSELDVPPPLNAPL